VECTKDRLTIILESHALFGVGLGLEFGVRLGFWLGFWFEFGFKFGLGVGLRQLHGKG
jgi:hypothetical protein